MKLVFFTKSLKGMDIMATATEVKNLGFEGLDLAVRPGYCINPENVATELPRAVKVWADMGLSVPMVTTPTDFTDPRDPAAERLLAACGEAGVHEIKLGYWVYRGEDYWARVEEIKRALAGTLVLLQEKTHAHLEALSLGAEGDELEAAARFARETLALDPEGKMARRGADVLREFLLRRMDRPIRVCGMVRNQGDPGGGHLADGALTVTDVPQAVQQGASLPQRGGTQLAVREVHLPGEAALAQDAGVGVVPGQHGGGPGGDEHPRLGQGCQLLAAGDAGQHLVHQEAAQLAADGLACLGERQVQTRLQQQGDLRGATTYGFRTRSQQLLERGQLLAGEDQVVVAVDELVGPVAGDAGDQAGGPLGVAHGAAHLGGDPGGLALPGEGEQGLALELRVDDGWRLHDALRR